MRRASMVAVALVCGTFTTGCAVQQQAEETKARGTIETGGYTWSILADGEGGNVISTYGLPGRQPATDAANILCKKYERIAQFTKQKGMLLLGIQQFEFNCVK